MRRIGDLQARYKDEAAVLARFNPDLQHKVLRNESAAYFAPYPTLADLRLAYGDGTPRAWLAVQLENLNEYAGVKDKLTKEQMRELAILIATEYHYLKVSELMLFFVRFKMGRYGQFFGNVDPLRITGALLEFRKERNMAYDKHEREERRRRDEEERKKAVTYAEWEAMKGRQATAISVRSEAIR